MKNSRRRRRLKSRAKTRPKSSCKRTSVNQQQLSFDQLEARHLLATLVVNSAADLPVDLSDGVVTLRDAIHAANTDMLVAPGAETGSGSDTITFDGSVFSGGTNSLIRLTEGELEITETLTIDGSTGFDVTVTGDAAGDDVTVVGNVTDVVASFGGTVGASDDLLDDNSRVLNFSALTGDLSLEGLTLTGGRTTGNNLYNYGQGRESTHSGGGIRFASSGSLSLSNSTLSGNSTSGFYAYGGGIYTESGSVSLTSSTLSGNSTSGYAAFGSGIGTRSGSVNLTSSTLSGNSTSGDSSHGGGIYTESGSVSLTRSTLSGNSTSGFDAFGGGIGTRSGSVSLTNSTLSGNSTSGDAAFGGGIATLTGSVNLTSSTLSDNSTSGDDAFGGGIGASAGSVSLANSTLSGNSTSGDDADGGGIRAGFGSVSLTSSTLSGNAAAMGVGGGVSVRNTIANSSFTIANSIVAGNTDNGTAPDLRPDPDSTLTINNSLIGVADLNIGGTGNLIGSLAAPIDPLLGPLADNSGPTETHALLVGSPAIDAGDDGVTQTEDQRGLARNVNGVDIGAFERQAIEPLGESPSVTSFTRDEGGVLDRPDLLSTISVSFDVDVNISADDLVIRNDTLGGSLVDTSGLIFNYDSTTQTATWDFSNLTLDAAFYSFELSSDIVSASGNLGLDGDADGNSGGAFIEPIYVAIPGDANLDGQVDVLGDAFELVGNLGVTGGATWAQGDFNGDGDVDVLGDAFILVGNLGRSVILPALAGSQAVGASTLAAVDSTPSLRSAAVIVEQAVESAEDEKDLVAAVPREVAQAASPELSGDQVRDDAFASEFGSLDSFWV